MSVVAVTAVVSLSYPPQSSNRGRNLLFDFTNRFNRNKRLSIITSSSSSAPLTSIDFTPLESALAKKDSDAVKEALDQLSEVGWAKRWSSQPNISRRTTSLGELTTLGMKNAENLAIPSVRND